MRLRRPSPHRTTTNSQSDWLFVIPGLFLTALLGLPLLALIARAFGQDFLTSISSDSALAALKISLITSSLSVAISLLAGTPLAYMLARWDFKGKSIVELLVDLPIVLPPSVAGLALLMAFGRQGLFGGPLIMLGISLPFTTAAVVIAQTFVSAPLYVRAARIGFAEIDPQLEEAAYVDGATRWQIFREVMLPLAGRALTSGAILAWARALGEFGATILFAGNLEGVTQTMPLAIYLGLERGLNVAIALSMMLIVISVGLLTLVRRLEKH